MSSFWGSKTVVVVTGSSQTIGRNIAQILGEKLCEDSLLILASRSIHRLRELKDEIKVKNSKVNVDIFDWDLKKPDLGSVKRIYMYINREVVETTFFSCETLIFSLISPF